MPKAPIRVSLARSREERETAYALLYRNYRDAGLISPNTSSLWLTKRHMLPTTINFVLRYGDEIVGAATLFQDSSLKLPLEEHLSLSEMRQMGGRIAELSLLAIEPEAKLLAESKAALYRYILFYASQYLGISHLLSQHHDSVLAESFPELYFRNVNVDGRKLQYFDVANLEDPQQLLGPDCDFQFPERHFYTMTDTVWNLDDFRYFFVEKTQLLAEANEHELKCLQNFYDFGEFHEFFEGRSSVIGKTGSSPRFKRFAMNCHATIVGEHADPVHLEVQDVSQKGLRAAGAEPLEPGRIYVLHISIGHSRSAEVIARVSWHKEPCYGFEIINSDQAWGELIQHLESHRSPTRAA